MPARSTEHPTPKRDARIWDNCPGRTRDTPPVGRVARFHPPSERGNIILVSPTAQGGMEMDDDTQQRIIPLVAAGIAYLISHAVTNRYIDVPDQRGIKDDALEAVLKGATTAASTILASVIVRRIVAGRWGA